MNRTDLTLILLLAGAAWALQPRQSSGWSATQRGLAYERRQATKLGATHLGGPGRPDYMRRGTPGEVKNWEKPVHSGEVWKAHEKGVREIVARSGFTGPAEDLASELGIRLRKGL